MKNFVLKLILAVLVVLFAACGNAPKANSNDAISLNEAIAKSAADIMKKVSANTKIAFFDISESEYSVVTGYVIEEISVILVDKAKLTVVDRNNMDIIDKEHEFQMSGRVSDDEIISIAKKYGASSVVSCSVSGQFDLRRLRVRALDVETGKVLSLTSHSVKNLADYAKPQAAASNANTSQTAIAVQSVPAAKPAPIPYEIGPDDTISATNRTLRNDGEELFLLTPSVSGWIVMETTGNLDTYMEFYDADTNHILDDDDDGGSVYNARIRYNVQSGRRYIVKVFGVDGDSGRYGFKAYREKIYQIGERGPAGGIIFYDKTTVSDGWRYLEAAPADTQMKNLKWGASRQDIPGTRGDLGSGKQNTQIIVNSLRLKNESGTAAQLCSQLNSGGKTDWFLPSREELQWMYNNLHSKGLGGFKNERYWSSTQVNSIDAWYLHFGDNGRASHNFTKSREGAFLTTGEIWTRAIRAF